MKPPLNVQKLSWDTIFNYLTFCFKKVIKVYLYVYIFLTFTSH